MVYPIFKRTVLLPLRLFLKKLEGVENIPKNGPFIVTSSYESYLDPLLIASVITPLKNKKIHFLAKKGRFWDLFGDRISRDYAGLVLLDGRKEEAFQDLLNLLKKDDIVAIFIEGDRSSDKKLKKGKVGVVKLALKAHVPILPIGLIGTYKIAPGNKLIPRLRRARMDIGRPIYLDKYYKQDINEQLLRKLTNDVMHVISKLTGKPYDY